MPEAVRRPPPGIGDVNVADIGAVAGQWRFCTVICAPAISNFAGGVGTASMIVAACCSSTSSRTRSAVGVPLGAPLDGGPTEGGADRGVRYSKIDCSGKPPCRSRSMRAHERRIRTRSTAICSGHTPAMPVASIASTVMRDVAPSETASERMRDSPLTESRGAGARGPATASVVSMRPRTIARNGSSGCSAARSARASVILRSTLRGSPITVPSTLARPPPGSSTSAATRIGPPDSGHVTSCAVRVTLGSSTRIGAPPVASTTRAFPRSTITWPIEIGRWERRRSAGAGDGAASAGVSPAKRSTSTRRPSRSRSTSAYGSRSRTSAIVTRSGHCTSRPFASMRRSDSNVRSPSASANRPPATSPRTRAVSAPA